MKRFFSQTRLCSLLELMIMSERVKFKKKGSSRSSIQFAVTFLFTEACVTGWLGRVLSCVCVCRTSSASHCRGVTLPWVMRTPPSKPPDQRPSTWPWRWLGSCCPVPQWWRVCCYRRRWRSSPSPPGVWSVTRSPTEGSNGTLRAWRHLEGPCWGW